MLFLMRAQRDCASRWVPLKRLCLPKSPAGGVGAGKWMVQETHKTAGLVRGILPLETGALNLAELRTQEETLPDAFDDAQGNAVVTSRQGS